MYFPPHFSMFSSCSWMLRSIYTPAGPSLCSVGQIIGWDPSQKAGEKPQKCNFSVQQAKSHQQYSSVTIQPWMTPLVFVRNCKRSQMKLKCSFPQEGKQSSLRSCGGRRSQPTVTPPSPHRHPAPPAFRPPDTPSFQCSDPVVVLQPSTMQCCYRALKQLLHFIPKASPFKWQGKGSLCIQNSQLHPVQLHPAPDWGYHGDRSSWCSTHWPFTLGQSHCLCLWPQKKTNTHSLFGKGQSVY